MDKLNCYVITDGNAGARSQAIGLAEALNIPYTEKTFRLDGAARIMAPRINFNFNKYRSKGSDDLDKIKPKLVIVCGSSARAAGPYLKKLHPNCFTIYVQDPKIEPRYYDLIIAPKHDKISGKNVIKTTFSLNRINDEKLSLETKKYKSLFANYPDPYSTILIGGEFKKYKMDHAAFADLANKVKTIIEINTGSFLISTSRRTPDALTQRIEEISQTHKNVYMYNFKDISNPFFAMLGLAKQIFVTNDSISMVSEAKATGKDVKIIKLLNNKNNKVSRFFDSLLQQKEVTLYDDNKNINHSKVNETFKVARQVKQLLLEKNIFKPKDF